MELPVTTQAAQFALAAGLGALLGLWYDLLRALRREKKSLQGLCDVLFSLVLLPALLLFALYAGRGVFRLFFFPAIALGAAGYFLTLSRAALPLFRAWFCALRRFFRLLRRAFKKALNFFGIFSKNLFARWQKWGTIIGKVFSSHRTDS